MPGTKLGGQRAAATNRERHGDDFYERIGAIGGSKGTTGGFAAGTEHECDLIEGLHNINRCAGVKGGTVSRRRKQELKEQRRAA